MKYQVEVLQLAHCRYTHILTGSPIAVTQNAQPSTQGDLGKEKLRLEEKSNFIDLGKRKRERGCVFRPSEYFGARQVLPVAKTMSSREIAEMTGKNHADVLRDIRNMLLELTGDTSGLSKFAASYLDSQNRSQPCFSLPKRETLILTSGYSIAQRARIIDRWQALESIQALALPSYQDALRQLADTLDKQSQLEQKITDDAPKVEFAMAVRRMDGCCSIEDIPNAGTCAISCTWKATRAKTYPLILRTNQIWIVIWVAFSQAQT